MATILRVPPEKVRERRQGTSAPLLVCAYDDEQKCAQLPVPGGLSYRDFESRLGEIPKDREIVFYCS
jgi:hypothetical protein